MSLASSVGICCFIQHCVFHPCRLWGSRPFISLALEFSIMWPYYSLFIYYSSDVHLKCFLELTTVNKLLLKFLLMCPGTLEGNFSGVPRLQCCQAVNIPLYNTRPPFSHQSSQTSFQFAFLQLCNEIKVPIGPYLIIFDIRYESLANLAHRCNLMVLAYIFMIANEFQHLHKYLSWMCLCFLFYL